MAKATDIATLLRATTTFVGRVNDEDIHVFKGDLVESTHPACKKWPDLFAPVVVRFAEPRVEQATAAPGEKRA